MKPEEKKKCSKCRKMKHISNFYAHPRTKDNLQCWCKECMKTGANARNKRLRRERSL